MKLEKVKEVNKEEYLLIEARYGGETVAYGTVLVEEATKEFFLKFKRNICNHLPIELGAELKWYIVRRHQPPVLLEKYLENLK